MNDEGNLAESIVFSMQELLRFQTQIEAALDYAGSTHTFNDVVRAVAQGEMLAYFFEDACVIAEIQEYPRMRVFHCFIGCGELRALMATLPTMQTVAEAYQCTQMSFSGRPGWERVWKDRDDWRKLSTTMVKDLQNVR